MVKDLWKKESAFRCIKLWKKKHNLEWKEQNVYWLKCEMEEKICLRIGICSERNKNVYWLKCEMELTRCLLRGMWNGRNIMSSDRNVEYRLKC